MKTTQTKNWIRRQINYCLNGNPSTTVITDCRENNAIIRVGKRMETLLGRYPGFVGIETDSEAAINLVDVLDAIDAQKKNIVMINIAPRNGNARKHINGSPFCYFWYKKTLIVSTIDGYSLSLVKKLSLVAEFNVVNTEEAVAAMILEGYMPESLRDHVTKTQFRSFEFMPRLAQFLYFNGSIKNNRTLITHIPDAPQQICYIDCFGNCKTTILPEEINFQEGGNIIFDTIGKISLYTRLKSVPDGHAAMIIGSSGHGVKRFLELVVQGSSAAQRFNLKPGYVLSFPK